MISIIKFSKKFYRPKSRTLKDIEKFAKEIGLPYSAVYRNFTIYVAHYILYRFKKAVREQRVSGKPFKSIYKPLNKQYKATKPYSTRSKFWINSGALVNKLGVYAVKNNIVHIGFRGRKNFIKNRDKVKFSEVLKYVEYGTRKMPARPLLRPIMISTRKNIGQLWRRYKNIVLVEGNYYDERSYTKVHKVRK